MTTDENIVEFKSINPFFELERDGDKPNTVRNEDIKDERFERLRFGKVDKIKIINKENPREFFIREITDISFWEKYVIISWKHLEQTNQNIIKLKKELKEFSCEGYYDSLNDSNIDELFQKHFPQIGNHTSVNGDSELGEVQPPAPTDYKKGCGKEQGIYKCGDIIGKNNEFIILCNSCSCQSKQEKKQ